MREKQQLINDIRNKISDGINTISLIYDRAPWSDQEFYANWLAQTFYYTRQATRVLTWAAAKTPHSHEWLHLKLLKHTEEEKSHEELARHDLKKIGYQMEEFPEMPITTAYYSTLFYLIDHLSPLCLFGYFSILEGLAVTAGDKLLNFVEKKYGKETGSFLIVHCQADIKHYEDDLNILEKFNEQELASIEKSAELSIQLYQSLMLNLISHHQSTSKAGVERFPEHLQEHKYNLTANQ